MTVHRLPSISPSPGLRRLALLTFALTAPFWALRAQDAAAGGNLLRITTVGQADPEDADRAALAFDHALRQAAREAALTLVLPGALSVLKTGGQALVLVKPQFELTREDVGPGGIVRDPEAHARACQRIQDFVQSQPDLEWRGLVESSIQGTDGNREFLAHFVRRSSPV